MKKITGFIFALTLLTSNSFADITFWTTEVQPARMEKQMEMAKSFETKTGIKVEVIPVEEKDLGSRATAAAAAGTKIIHASAPVSFTASFTVLKIGLSRCFVPPLPGVTPATKFVP